MASKQLSAVTAGAAVDDADLFYVVQGGNSRKLTGAQLKAFANDGLTLEDLADVDTAGVVTGDVLTWDGTEYVMAPPPGSGGGSGGTVPNGGTTGQALVKLSGVDQDVGWGAGVDYEAGPAGTVPTAASLTWVNQDSSAITEGVDALILTTDLNSELHGLYMAAPAAPFDIYMRLNTTWISTSAETAALQMMNSILVRDGADGEIVTFGFFDQRVGGDEQHSRRVQFTRWNSLGAFVADGTQKHISPVDNFQWLRLNVGAATLTGYVSSDGKNWIEISTEPLATYIDAVTDFGICGFGLAANTQMKTIVSYLGTTAPA